MGRGGKLTPYLCGDSIWKSPNYVIMSLGKGEGGGGATFQKAPSESVCEMKDAKGP